MQMKHIALLWKLRTLLHHPVRTMRLFLNAETPMLAKALLLAAVAYVLMPLDFLPDFVPLVGQIDDITLTLLLVSYGLSLIPDSVYEKAGLDHVQVKNSAQ